MPRDLTCREFIEFLMAWREGELPEGERRAFEGHLSVCADCVDYLRSYEAAVGLGRAACADPADGVPDEVPAELVEAILAARASRG